MNSEEIAERIREITGVAGTRVGQLRKEAQNELGQGRSVNVGETPAAGAVASMKAHYEKAAAFQVGAWSARDTAEELERLITEIECTDEDEEDVRYQLRIEPQAEPASEFAGVAGISIGTPGTDVDRPPLVDGGFMSGRGKLMLAVAPARTITLWVDNEASPNGVGVGVVKDAHSDAIRAAFARESKETLDDRLLLALGWNDSEDHDSEKNELAQVRLEEVRRVIDAVKNSATPFASARAAYTPLA